MRNKRKKFVDLAEARVNRAIKDLKLIGNLSNRSSYEYSDSDVKQIFDALNKELNVAKSRFSESGKGGSDFFKLKV
jgi:hypothetical protein